MTDLDKLIEAVEAGDDSGASTYYTSRIFTVGFCHATNAYYGSLDAAKALHEALLPGASAMIGTKIPRALVHTKTGKAFTCLSNSPARAWLLAILKAHRAQVQG